MSLLTILLVIIVAGVVLWAVGRFIPMAAGFQTLLRVVVAIVLVIWLLKAFGVLSALGAVHI